MTLSLRFWTKKMFLDEVRTNFNYELYIAVLKAKNEKLKIEGYDIRK